MGGDRKGRKKLVLLLLLLLIAGIKSVKCLSQGWYHKHMITALGCVGVRCPFKPSPWYGIKPRTRNLTSTAELLPSVHKALG